MPATEDRGEGVFLQFDETASPPGKRRSSTSPVWEAFREAHRAQLPAPHQQDSRQTSIPTTRFPAPRYWAIHTLSHLLIREAAMSSGYGSASLTERIYAWRGDDERPAAAGLLITTTASDSEGTLGGLVELARPEKLARLVPRRFAGAAMLVATRSARTACRAARRTSSTAPPATSASSSARPAASGPTGSSTAACCSA